MLPPDDLREQITAAFEYQDGFKTPASSHPAELPPNAILVETFGETCGMLGYLSDFPFTVGLMGELLLEFFCTPQAIDRCIGLERILSFLRCCPPTQNRYTGAQIAAVQAWLRHIIGRDDLWSEYDLIHDTAQEVLALWEAAFAETAVEKKRLKRKRNRH